MPSVSVSNLELYRMWRESEELDLQWLLNRLRGLEPQTEAMTAGEALHKAIEKEEVEGMTEALVSGEYTFRFQCDCSIELPTSTELRIEKQYGELTVRGRVDALTGKTVTDYKSTQSFDADRLLEGFQWRYYLDMTGCDTFIWKVFVLKELFFKQYGIIQVHELKQHRYDRLGDDCEKLAADFLTFARQLEENNTEWTRAAVLEA